MLRTKEAYNISIDLESRDWRFSLMTMLCMVCCQRTLKKRHLSDEDLSFFTMTQHWRHCTVVHTTLSSCVAFLI